MSAERALNQRHEILSCKTPTEALGCGSVTRSENQLRAATKKVIYPTAQSTSIPALSAKSKNSAAPNQFPSVSISG